MSVALPFVTTALRLLAGAIVWALHFALIYGFTALACARGSPDAVPWVIAFATLTAGAACLALIVRQRPWRSFEAGLASGITTIALLAIAWEALPIFMVPVCS